MSKKLTPIAKAIALFTKYYNFYSVGNPMKEAFKVAIEDLKVFLPVEKEFARDAYNDQNWPSWITSFDEFYKQYNNE